MDAKGGPTIIPVSAPRAGEGSMRTLARRALVFAVMFAVGYGLCVPYVRVFFRSAPHCTRNALTLAEEPELIWSMIKPNTSATLQWAACYEDMQCAKMSVPLDYANPSVGQAEIAIVKLPSKYAYGDDNYRGPILFNPGGPGGSGVGMIVGRGKMAQKLIGDEYDIVGFDPRGVSRSSPQVVVFPDKAEDAAWRLHEGSDPAANTTADAISRIYSRGQIFGEIAQRTTMHASPYVSTALVARDMLNIMRAHGYDKLQYWGFSYGTILGSTYAAMFPDNVGRLIIDGVADAYDYYKGIWSNNLIDTDKTLYEFLDACAKAGPELCAIHEPTADAVSTRLHSILEHLKRRPLSVATRLNGSAPQYGLVDYKMAHRVLFSYLYSPYGSNGVYFAQNLSHAFAEAEKGNGAPLGRLTGLVPTPFKCECPAPGPPVVPLLTPDTMTAIACGDGGLLNDTEHDLEKHFKKMFADSEFADMWSYRARCSGWKIQSAERFEGPFVGNTSYPLLIIGNRADPVTPLTYAHKMSKGFTDSVVLTQDSAGHCSLAASSLCTAKAIREYFREGTLPKKGTICAHNSTVFPTNTSQPVQALSAEDQGILDAWQDLVDNFEVPMFGLH